MVVHGPRLLNRIWRPALVALVLAAVCFSLWLVHVSLQAEESEARAAYEELLAQAESAGWATDYDSLAGPAPPPGENGAPLLRRAFALFEPREPLCEDDKGTYDDLESELYLAEDGLLEAPDPVLHERFRRLLDDRTAAFDLLHQGLAMPACHYGIDWTQGFEAPPVDLLVGLKKACLWVVLRGYSRLVDGDLEGACTDIESAVRLSDSLARVPSPPAMLVRTATGKTALYLARTILLNPAVTDYQADRIAALLASGREHASYVMLLQVVMANVTYLTDVSLGTADSAQAAGEAGEASVDRTRTAVYRDAAAVLRRTLAILERAESGWDGMRAAGARFQPIDRTGAPFTEISDLQGRWLKREVPDGVFCTWAQHTAHARAAAALVAERARSGSLPERLPDSAPHDPLTGEEYPWNPDTCTLERPLSESDMERVVFDWQPEVWREAGALTLPE